MNRRNFLKLSTAMVVAAGTNQEPVFAATETT